MAAPASAAVEINGSRVDLSYTVQCTAAERLPLRNVSLPAKISLVLPLLGIIDIPHAQNSWSDLSPKRRCRGRRQCSGYSYM